MAAALSVAACGLPGAIDDGGGGARAAGSGGASSSSSHGAGGGGAGHPSASSSSSGAGGQGGAAPNAFRRPIDVRAGSAAVPGHYSIAIVLDHQTLVAAGKSLASGDDVRVFHKGNGLTELDRVLGLETQWNTATTEIWFRSTSPIPAGGDDGAYFVYYGDPTASSPPADPNQVHLFFDDFEGGSLARWTDQLSGFGGIDASTARSGTSSLKVSTVGSQERWLTANGVDASDISVDAYWRVSAAGGFDISQCVRASATPSINDVETNYVSSPGFDIATMKTTNWNEVVSPPSQPAVMPNTWVRVTTSIVGTKFRVLVGGVQTVPSSGWTDVGAQPATDVGLRAWKVPGGQAWWVDDVRVRKLVDPEPTTTYGPEEPASFPP